MASGSQRSTEPQKNLAGEYWSGANPVPTAQTFAYHPGPEKKERDRRLDQEGHTKGLRAAKGKGEDKGSEEHERNHEDVSPHQPRGVSRANIRTVTDPTTGKDIDVEDQDETSKDDAKNPKVHLVFTFNTKIVD